jgi:hypothetical protein
VDDGEAVMTLESAEIIEQLRSKIGRYLRTDNLHYEVRPNGDYGVRHGSTMVFIQPRMWGDLTLVQLLAPVSLEISTVTPQLTRYLCEMNNEMLFGKFSLDVREKAIWCEHTLLRDFLDPDELLVAVESIVTAADDHDEKVAEMSGGKRAIDMDL